MKSVLITGANRGIGLALTELYLNHNWHVYASCRKPLEATALNSLADTFSNLSVLEMNITDYQQVAQIAKQLDHVNLDLIINNAGIYGPKGYGFGACDVTAWRDVLETNCIAPAKLAEFFVEHLKLSDQAVFAALSSRVGSHTENTKGGGYLYRSSKAALNSVIKSLSNDLLPLGIKTVALHPGWVKTQMGGPNALISAQESALGLKHVLDNLTEQQSGGFYSYKGEEIPW